jgi:hypothetical protein
MSVISFNSHYNDEFCFENENVEIKRMKKKLNLTKKLSVKVNCNKFLDTDLISELLFKYLKEHKVAVTKFTRFILKMRNELFYTKLSLTAFWHLRSYDVKKIFHKVNFLLNQKPYSQEMKDIESNTYKRRMEHFTHLMESSGDSFEAFLTKKLHISKAKFKQLRRNCIEETPLDDESKIHVAQISEFISKTQLGCRRKFQSFKNPIKSWIFLNIILYFQAL